ncbi:MAG: hypothetical protein LIP09_16355 [Bacteroidales bacterium]|nr:hypothetical protein [Bacteroidales bacterium]
MDETSTQLRPVPATRLRQDANVRPSLSTIQFLRQFARSYMPVAKLPGIVLN